MRAQHLVKTEPGKGKLPRTLDLLKLSLTRGQGKNLSLTRGHGKKLTGEAGARLVLTLLRGDLWKDAAVSTIRAPSGPL
jgi:hypothetical protein